MPTNRIASLILFSVVAMAPLPFGSTSAIAIAFWCILLGIAAVTVSARGLQPAHFVFLGLTAIFIAVYAFVLREQLVAKPWFAASYPLWQQAAVVLETPLEPSASIVRYQPFFSLGASLAAMLAGIVSLVVCADRHRASQLLKVIAWSGSAYAAYAIVSFLFDPTRILWWEKEAYRNVLTTPFINRNTAAVYYGSCAVVCLLLLFEHMRQHLPRPILWRSVPRQLSSLPSRKTVTTISMAFLCLTAMFMTGSRAGVVISLMATVVVFATFFYRDLPPRFGIVAVLFGGGLVAIALLEVLGAGVSGRFNMQGIADEGRFETYRATWLMIKDHPWFGSGLGTFAWSYPAYRSENVSMWGVWDRAHSTILEIASDLGLPLAGLIVLIWMVVIGLLVRGSRMRGRGLCVSFAALYVAMIAHLHSLIDFSLQIPGYAIVVFALVGAGISQSFSSKIDRDAFKYS